MSCSTYQYHTQAPGAQPLQGAMMCNCAWLPASASGKQMGPNCCKYINKAPYYITTDAPTGVRPQYPPYIQSAVVPTMYTSKNLRARLQLIIHQPPACYQGQHLLSSATELQPAARCGAAASAAVLWHGRPAAAVSESCHQLPAPTCLS